MLHFQHPSAPTRSFMPCPCSPSRRIKVILQQSVGWPLAFSVWGLILSSVYLCQGTGVVTSVPSDSPDDFAALRDLKKKQVSLLAELFLFLFSREKGQK